VTGVGLYTFSYDHVGMELVGSGTGWFQMGMVSSGQGAWMIWGGFKNMVRLYMWNGHGNK